MAHSHSPAAEEILDSPFPVLDHGFIRLVDYMGSDERIVQAARVSYGKGTSSFRRDKGLIDYLLRNEHTSPFEQVVFTFHIKLPIFVARQWIRHRTARVNEISARYSVLDQECYVPSGDAVAFQSADNKQGRDDSPVGEQMQQEVREKLSADQERSFAVYSQLLEQGVARELARINLPLSTYTQWYWQIDLHNLLHFLNLRMNPHAQMEIREYAQVLYSIAQRVCPLACVAFEEHVLHGVRFSRREAEALEKMLSGQECPLEGRAREIFFEKLHNRNR